MLNILTKKIDSNFAILLQTVITVLCKRNANEIRRFSFFVLAKIRRNFVAKFRQSAREFSSSQTKFRCH